MPADETANGISYASESRRSHAPGTNVPVVRELDRLWIGRVDGLRPDRTGRVAELEDLAAEFFDQVARPNHLTVAETQGLQHSGVAQCDHLIVDEQRQIIEALLASSQARVSGEVRFTLRPGNLFITSARALKLLDFGIAKPTKPGGP